MSELQLVTFDEVVDLVRDARAREPKGFAPVTRSNTARVASTELGPCDGAPAGPMTFWVHLDYAHGGQALGGWALDGDDGGDLGARAVRHVLAVFGASRWEALGGLPCRVYRDSAKVHAIGHFLEDRWWCASTWFAEQQREQTGC